MWLGELLLPLWFQDRNNLLLLAALLLCLWLWLLVRRREEEIVRPMRASPLDENEMGRTLLRVARSHDLHTYRDLFINGQEAAELMGDAVDDYLAARPPEVLAQSLLHISSQVPVGAIFVSAHVDAEDHFFLTVQAGQSVPITVHCGIVTMVGVAMRLFSPATSTPA